MQSRPWILLPAVAIAVRLLVVGVAAGRAGDDGVFLYHDSGQYLRLAENLAAEGRLQRGGAPEIFRPPGYPLLLAPGAALGNAVAWGILVQILLAAATVAAAMALARALGATDAQVAAAGLLCALEPTFAVFSVLLLSETLFALVLVVAVLGLVRYRRDGSRLFLAVAAVATAAAAYVRAIGYVLPFVAAALLAAAAVRSRRGGRDAVAFTVLTLALLLPWHLRNGIETGFWGFSAQIGRHARSLGDAAARAAGALPESEVYAALQADQNDIALARSGTDVGLRRLVDHPVDAVWTHVKGMALVVFDPGAGSLRSLLGVDSTVVGVRTMWWTKGPAAAVRALLAADPRALAVFFVTLAATLTVIGLALLSLFDLDRPGIHVVWGMVGALVVASGGPFGWARFRAPLEPLLVVLAAVGAGVAARRVKAWRRRDGALERAGAPR